MLFQKINWKTSSSYLEDPVSTPNHSEALCRCVWRCEQQTCPPLTFPGVSPLNPATSRRAVGFWPFLAYRVLQTKAHSSLSYKVMCQTSPRTHLLFPANTDDVRLLVPKVPIIRLQWMRSSKDRSAIAACYASIRLSSNESRTLLINCSKIYCTQQSDWDIAHFLCSYLYHLYL